MAQTRSTSDKRSISYDVTESGHQLVNTASDLDAALTVLPAEDSLAVQQSLEATVRQMLKRRGFRSFGICETCKHHQATQNRRFCKLLNLPLMEEEADELCHEHVPIAQSN